MMASRLTPKPSDREQRTTACSTSMPPRIGMTVSMHGPSAASGTPAALRLLQVSGTIWCAEDGQHRGRVDVRQPVLDDRVHDEQQRHLEQQRQAAGERAHAALLEELLLRDAGLHGVALVALLDLLDLRLEELHPPLRGELPAIQRDDHGAHDQGQDDDRPADRRRDAEVLEEDVDADQDDQHRLEDRVEQPGEEAEGVGAGLRRGQRRVRRRGRRGAAGLPDAAVAPPARAGRHDERDEGQQQDRPPRQAPQAGWDHERDASLADGVIAAPAPGLASGDTPGAHPGSLQRARISRWPARCSASSSARSGTTRASRRRRRGRA